MTLDAAVKKLKKEQEFLGTDLATILNLIETNPGMFSHSTVDAYEVYREHALVRSNIS